MGILNATPDSFSDGGDNFSLAQGLKTAFQMIDDGADILDIGGESTRPGADLISIDEECRRVLPLIKEIKSGRPDSIISIDTRKSDVAREAIAAGADIVNDVSGLQFSENMIHVIAETGAGVMAMHMRGTPETMQNSENLIYNNVVDDVMSEFQMIIKKVAGAGISKEFLVLDPGIGFSKNCEQNIELIRGTSRLKTLGFPLLYGISRKSFIGQLLGEPDPNNRLYGTLGATAQLINLGVDFIRVHDVKATKQMITLFNACKGA
jgi:dihydropteroate synthase